jgi:hypothetical protein
MRNAQRRSGGAGPSLNLMKNRFPFLHRTGWRQRFVAIARQADAVVRRPAALSMEAAPRRPVDGDQRAQVRVRFAAITSH